MAITLPRKTEPWARSDKKGGHIGLIDLNGQLVAASVVTSAGRFISVGHGGHQIVCAGTELAALSNGGLCLYGQDVTTWYGLLHYAYLTCQTGPVIFFSTKKNGDACGNFDGHMYPLLSCSLIHSSNVFYCRGDKG